MVLDLVDFRLGFICARRSQALVNAPQLTKWHRLLAPQHKFFVHPEVSVQTITDARDRRIVVLGDIFVAHGDEDLKTVLLRIANGDRGALDDLSGRFAMFILDGEAATVMHDPLGSQAVFYSLGPDSVVASHATLLAHAIDARPSAERRAYMQSSAYANRTTRFLPGDLTLYDDIVHLIPNNELNMRSGMTRRYWPARVAVPTDFEGLFGVWTEYFSNYVRFLEQRYTPVAGLTGGLDSRAVIATLRSLGLQTRYVTWDMGVAEASRIPGLVRHLGSQHDWMRLAIDAVDPSHRHLVDAARDATGLVRGRPVRPAIMAATAGARDVFVKGDGGAVMSGPWHATRKPWMPDTLDARMYRLYAGQQSDGAGEDYTRTTREAIERYIDRANYGSELHGSDIGDLFYWEHRLGVWGSLQHSEIAVTMQSHAAMNSRRLFESAWGLPVQQRSKHELLPRITARFDPVLAAL